MRRQIQAKVIFQKSSYHLEEGCRRNEEMGKSIVFKDSTDN